MSSVKVDILRRLTAFIIIMITYYNLSAYIHERISILSGILMQLFKMRTLGDKLSLTIHSICICGCPLSSLAHLFIASVWWSK